MRPLDGIRVLDFARVLAGPMATQILFDLGAEVIKVERPGTGDESRQFEPFFKGGQSAYFSAFNRGKQSVAIDMGCAEGRKLALSLSEKADIVVENFLPGTMDRFGLGYRAVSERNPQVVYISNTGFGQTGPYRDWKGYDTIFQAMSGIIDLTGHADSPPAKVGVPFADMTSGLWIVISALAGLMGRHATGRGCHVDLSMMDVQVSLLGLPAAWWFAEGRKPVRTGTEHLGRVPSAAFECRGGEWLFLSGSDQHWDDICRVLCLDAPEWMARNSARVERRNEVMTMLRAAIILRERSELAEALRAAGVPVGEVNSVPEILSNPHTLARGMIGAYEDAERGQRPALATPCRMSGYDGPNFSPPPRLGAETRTVLSNLLGLSVEEIDELEARGTIA